MSMMTTTMTMTVAAPSLHSAYPRGHQHGRDHSLEEGKHKHTFKGCKQLLDGRLDPSQHTHILLQLLQPRIQLVQPLIQQAKGKERIGRISPKESLKSLISWFSTRQDGSQYH